MVGAEVYELSRNEKIKTGEFPIGLNNKQENIA
jgi:hypothetical protein